MHSELKRPRSFNAASTVSRSVSMHHASVLRESYFCWRIHFFAGELPKELSIITSLTFFFAFKKSLSGASAQHRTGTGGFCIFLILVVKQLCHVRPRPERACEFDQADAAPTPRKHGSASSGRRISRCDLNREEVAAFQARLK